MTNVQKERAIREFEIIQNKRAFIGKIMIIFIASANIVMWLLSAAAGSAIGTLIIEFLSSVSKAAALINQFLFSNVFISNVPWFRYFFDMDSLNVFVIFCVLIVQFILSKALISGVEWVRYFLAVGSVLNTFAVFYTLMIVAPESAFPLWSIIVLSVNLIYCIASGILLFGSKCISEYMYAKSN